MTASGIPRELGSKLKLMSANGDRPTPRPGSNRGKRRIGIIALTFCAIALLCSLGAFALRYFGADTPAPETSKPAATPTETQPAKEPEKTEPADPIHFIAMGDMLPHDSVNANAEKPGGGYDYGQFFAGIRGQLTDADVTFCNQEVPSAGVDFGISGYPTFNAPAEFAQDLHGVVGCDLVNLANNHNADKGAEGIAATRQVWDKLTPAAVDGVNRNAEEQRTVPIFEQDGVKIALVSFAEFSNAPIDEVSLNLMGDDALVQELMTKAREQADVVVVSAHWGTEDSHEVNDAQRAFAAKVADLGADVVIGTGPHVIQPVQWLDRAGGGKTLVWYSLGNMLNTQLGLDQRTGMIAGFDIARDDAGAITIEKPTAILTYMHYDWTAEEEAAGDLFARKDLSITPLADSDPLLARTRFGVTAPEQMTAMTEILGPDVTIVDR